MVTRRVRFPDCTVCITFKADGWYYRADLGLPFTPADNIGPFALAGDAVDHARGVWT